MCTIALLHRVHPSFPVVLAGNRDEFYARSADPPRALCADPPIVGGLDREGGGTWLALTPSGALAAITNQRTWQPDRPARRSRGAIPIELLRAIAGADPAERLARARAHLEALDPEAQNSFNLLYADLGGALVAYGRRRARAVEVEELPPGLFVLGNDRLGSPAFPKLRRAEGLIEAHARAPWRELRPRLARALADHELPPAAAIEAPPAESQISAETAELLQAICIHTPSYGTRSATIAAVAPDGVARYEFADGPPCRAPFRDVADLVRA